MIPIQHLERGTRLKLKDGTVVEVTENPRDGVWLYGRIVPAQSGGETEALVNADDVVAVL